MHVTSILISCCSRQAGRPPFHLHRASFNTTNVLGFVRGGDDDTEQRCLNAKRLHTSFTVLQSLLIVLGSRGTAVHAAQSAYRTGGGGCMRVKNLQDKPSLGLFCCERRLSCGSDMHASAGAWQAHAHVTTPCR